MKQDRIQHQLIRRIEICLYFIRKLAEPFDRSRIKACIADPLFRIKTVVRVLYDRIDHSLQGFIILTAR